MNRMARERIAVLCDQLLRRGAPRAAVQPVVDWLEGQSYTAGHAYEAVGASLVCRKCGYPYTLGAEPPRCDKTVTGSWTP